MSPPQRLPVDVQRHVDELVGELEAIAAGADSARAIEVAESAIAAASRQHEEAFDPYNLELLMEQVPGVRLRELREEAGWSQDQLARAMSELGFSTWYRQTVALVEVQFEDDEGGAERKPRRLTFSELLGLAALFGVPAMDLLVPRKGATVVLTDNVAPLSTARLRELIHGRNGKHGTGGANWPVALLPTGANRPARQLWSRRRAAENGE